MSDLPENAETVSTDSQRNEGKPVRRRWRKWAIEAVIVIIVIIGVRTWQQRHMVNGPAPLLQGSLLSGNAYVLPEHPDKPVLVHFWATWCPVCRTEQGSISDISADHAVITVALWDKSKDEVQKFAAEQQLKFPVIYDPDNSIAKQWGVYAVPASFIIGTDGRIRFKETGYTTELGMRLRLWLAEKL